MYKVKNTLQEKLTPKYTAKNWFYTPSQSGKTIQQAFKPNVCNLTVLNHDGIIGFKSVAYFLEYAKVLSEKCYKDTNDNVPGFSKSNKVKWSNIVQLKFMEEKTEVIFYK